MDIGFTKLLLFGMIALIVLGPEKLPHAVRTAGRYYAKFRRTLGTIQHEIETELNLAEARQQMQEELAKIRQTETDIKREMEKLRSSVSELQQSHPLADTPLPTPAVENATNTIDPNAAIETTATPDAAVLAKDLQQAVHCATDPDYQKKPDASIAQSLSIQTADMTNAANPGITQPLYYHWFLLSDYDKQRRLPKPPFLPNYHADKLLF